MIKATPQKEMKQQIWKYQIVKDMCVIQMPRWATVLSVQAQNEIPCIWAMIDPAQEMVDRHFEIYGTGHDIPTIGEGTNRTYIGTFQLEGGKSVFHLFERHS